MLTREENEKLRKLMEGWILEKDCICVTHYADIMLKINELTETPKPEEVNFLMKGITMLKDTVYVLSIREFKKGDE